MIQKLQEERVKLNKKANANTMTVVKKRDWDTEGGTLDDVEVDVSAKKYLEN